MTDLPDRAARIRRATARLCALLDWVPLHEVSLANGRRADILALRPDGGFVCIEIKSGARDFQVDQKWPDYRDFADTLYFAVDADFPQHRLPDDVGLIVTADGEAALLRDGANHSLSPARRRALTLHFARLAGRRLGVWEDPEGRASRGLRAE